MTETLVKHRESKPKRQTYLVCTEFDMEQIKKAMMYFDDFFQNSYPKANVYEEGDKYEVNIYAPMIDKTKCEITLDDHILTVAYEGHYHDDRTWHIKEHNPITSFKRSFRLPKSIDENHVKAEYIDGVLRMVVPKHEKSRQKLIAIS